MTALAAKLTAAHTAFLIIDVQQALCEGPYEVLDAKGTIHRINLVSQRARAAGAAVVVIQHESIGGAMPHGSPGWQLGQGLVVSPSDQRLRKTATDSFHQTGLHESLQQQGIKHLVVAGFQSDFCVDTTVRRALALGYPVTLVADGHATLDNAVLSAAQIAAHHNLTLANITSFGPRATPVPARDVLFG